jgi:hypothetical protein
MPRRVSSFDQMKGKNCHFTSLGFAHKNFFASTIRKFSRALFYPLEFALIVLQFQHTTPSLQCSQQRHLVGVLHGRCVTHQIFLFAVVKNQHIRFAILGLVDGPFSISIHQKDGDGISLFSRSPRLTTPHLGKTARQSPCLYGFDTHLVVVNDRQRAAWTNQSDEIVLRCRGIRWLFEYVHAMTIHVFFFCKREPSKNHGQCSSSGQRRRFFWRPIQQLVSKFIQPPWISADLLDLLGSIRYSTILVLVRRIRSKLGVRWLSVKSSVFLSRYWPTRWWKIKLLISHGRMICRSTQQFKRVIANFCVVLETLIGFR